VARAEPPPQSGVLFDYVTAHIWQPRPSDANVANEGTIRAQALVDESGFPSDLSGPLKDLVGQPLLNPFINSGGARYIPPFSAETVLVEDFPETREVPATGELLSALGLGRRRASPAAKSKPAYLSMERQFCRNGCSSTPSSFGWCVFRSTSTSDSVAIAAGADNSNGRTSTVFKYSKAVECERCWAVMRASADLPTSSASMSTTSVTR
jgi:hypothetical protein